MCAWNGERSPVSDAVKIALIVSAAPTLMALASFVAALCSVFKLQKVHQDVNGRIDELVKATAAQNFAAGVKSEQDKGKPK